MRNRYITLEELMKSYFPEIYMRLSSAIGRLTRLDIPFDTSTAYKAEENLGGILVDVLQDCTRLDLVVSMTAVNDTIKSFESGVLPNGQEWLFAVRHVEQTIRQEMRSKVIVLLEPPKVPLAFEPHQFGEQVDLAFPSADWDIEEAARCLAFDRWTAGVFHMMRVAEIATVKIAERVGYVSEMPSFGGALGYLDRGLEKARKTPKDTEAQFVTDSEWLKEVLGNMRSVNVAWRQRVAHMAKKYTEEEAMRIWEATKSLMQHLAIKLKEEVV